MQKQTGVKNIRKFLCNKVSKIPFVNVPFGDKLLSFDLNFERFGLDYENIKKRYKNKYWIVEKTLLSHFL